MQFGLKKKETRESAKARDGILCLRTESLAAALALGLRLELSIADGDRLRRRMLS